ncbi:ABC-2 transporter permease [Paraliobacillus salinarum]|uniref:ABC-2 transporter permease n=1 Tax=Paraliobacillus salinarum TaxID=1158996 RepID=UPI001FEC2F81|nr:ABC-2 transporter permease [Paraliobacillus salinarum]
MLMLWKKDFFIMYKLFLVMFAAIFLFGAIGQTVLFIVYFIILFCFSIFREDKNNRINIFIKSLPISAKKMVYSRYVFLFVSVVLFMTLLRLMNMWATISRGKGASAFVFPFRMEDFIYAFVIVILVLSISLPIFYLFQKKLLLEVLLFIWFALWAFAIYQSGQFAEKQTQYDFLERLTYGISDWLEMIMPFSPSVSMIVALLLYGFSMLLTEQILKRRS